MKKKSTKKKFASSKQMDDFLEQSDLGEDFAQRGILKKARTKKINLDLPEEMVRNIDQVANRVGVARQPLLKLWIYQMLKAELPHE